MSRNADMAKRESSKREQEPTTWLAYQMDSGAVVDQGILTPAGIQQLLTAAEIAAMLGVAVKTVLSWAELGKIPHYKFGGGRKAPVRFSLPEISAWMQTWKKGPESGYHTTAETVAGARKGGK